MRSAKEFIVSRPKVSSLRDVQLKLNLTAAEYECVVRRARAVGMRPNHFGRAMVLKKEAALAVNQRSPSNAERLTYHVLGRVGSNLNQVARRMHQTGEPAPADLEPLLADIRRIIDRAMKKWL
jgi:Bacterial mobilisation protein (MobC)